MKCICPKCKEYIELELDEISEDGSSVKCTACSAGFLFRKESFACRALHKGDEITCAECGAPLGTAIYCQGCHAIYPDFYVADTSSATKKSLGKFFSRLRFGKRSVKIRTESTSDLFQGQRPAAGAKTGGMRLPSNPVQIAIMLIVLALVAGGGGYVWYQNMIESKYAEEYVRVLYGIKSVSDSELKACERIGAEWKLRMSPTPPPLTKEEQVLISRAKTSIDNSMKRLGEPPEKFKPSSDALKKLYDSYKNIETFTATPSGSVDGYIATTIRLADEFRSTSSAVKAAMPEKLATQLAEGKKKYKQLENF